MQTTTFRKVGIPLLLTIVFVFSGILFSGTAHAASVTAQQENSLENLTPSWIVQTNPYVHVANYVATIDPSIRLHVTKSDVQQTISAVRMYNSLSIQQKESVQTTHLASLGNNHVAPDSCRMSITRSVQWWGIAFYFNHCAVTTLILSDAISGAVAGAVALFCTPCAPVAGAIAIIFGLDAGVLSWDDAQCSSGGAYIDESWAGIWWETPAC